MHKLKEDAVRAVASVMGPASASAAALKDAEARRARGEVVEFYQHRSSVLVFGTPVVAQPQPEAKGPK